MVRIVPQDLSEPVARTVADVGAALMPGQLWMVLTCDHLLLLDDPDLDIAESQWCPGCGLYWHVKEVVDG